MKKTNCTQCARAIRMTGTDGNKYWVCMPNDMEVNARMHCDEFLEDCRHQIKTAMNIPNRQSLILD